MVDHHSQVDRAKNDERHELEQNRRPLRLEHGLFQTERGARHHIQAHRKDHPQYAEENKNPSKKNKRFKQLLKKIIWS